jgi:hypothetical protein
LPDEVCGDAGLGRRRFHKGCRRSGCWWPFATATLQPDDLTEEFQFFTDRLDESGENTAVALVKSTKVWHICHGYPWTTHPGGAIEIAYKITFDLEPV